MQKKEKKVYLIAESSYGIRLRYCKGRYTKSLASCEAIYDNFRCTLPKGHSGPHVACGKGIEHEYKVWEEKETEVTISNEEYMIEEL